jgi:phosphate transport system protein
MATRLEASLQKDIDLIRENIQEMAMRCEVALRDGLTAFLEGDRRLAYLVILRDQHIDELERQVDRLCLEFLIRQQPVGQHLRMVYAAFKINGELERIGDYAESIARQALKLNHQELHMSFAPFEEEADLAIRMLHDAVRAFVDENEELARSTMAVEDLIDERRREIDQEILRLGHEGRLPVGSLTPLMTVSRRFERTSDQAKNICAQVLYMCTGDYTRHQGSKTFRMLFLDEAHGALSRLAEALVGSLNDPRLQASSAGIHPGQADPRLPQFLQTKGIPGGTSRHTPAGEAAGNGDYQVIVALDEASRAALPRGSTETVGFSWNPPRLAPPDSPAYARNEDLEAAHAYLATHVSDLVSAVMGHHPSPPA